jgi:hypothetical protein
MLKVSFSRVYRIEITVISDILLNRSLIYSHIINLEFLVIVSFFFIDIKVYTVKVEKTVRQLVAC